MGNLKTFVFGIENYCKVKFIGDEDNQKKFSWFVNLDKVMLKNGFDLDYIIHNEVEVQYEDGINNYFEIEYKGVKRYFKELDLSTYIINKGSLYDLFQPLDYLVQNKIKFLYLIDAGDYVSLDSIFISDNVLNLAKSGVCKIVLNMSYEPYSLEKFDFLQILNRFVSKYGLTKEILKIVSGNLIIKDNPNNPYEFVSYCYFLENPWFIQKDVFGGDPFKEQAIKKIDENFKLKLEEHININRSIKHFDKKILCYNRRAHNHRRLLFYYFVHSEIIKNNSYISLNNLDDHRQRIPYNYLYNLTLEESDRINSFFHNNNSSWSFDGHDLNYNLANNFEEEYHKKTFMSVISETSTVDSVVFFSEKTFKPIYACQPFIISGNPFSLKKLKEFGFQTFDRWWDESYDSELKYENRLKKIINVVEYICNKSDEELILMINEMEEVLRHNYNTFINAKNQEFYRVFNSIGFLKNLI